MSERKMRLMKWGLLISAGLVFQAAGTGCTTLSVLQTGLLGLMAFSTFFIAREVS